MSRRREISVTVETEFVLLAYLDINGGRQAMQDKLQSELNQFLHKKLQQNEH